MTTAKLHANKRSDFQIAHDRHRIVELLLRGKRQYEIAPLLKVSSSQISYDLSVIKSEWKKNTTIDLDEAKRVELAKIDYLEREFWMDWERYRDAWEASKSEKTKARQRKNATGATIDASMEKEQRDGNPSFLDGMLKCKDGILKCQERRCKLLGLDAPAKSELAVTQPIAVTIDR